jgi:hypothetical protein
LFLSKFTLNYVYNHVFFILSSDFGDCSSFGTQLETLLQWESKEIVAKAAKVVAELAKSEAGREEHGNIAILKILVERLKTKEQDLDVLTQICRALGNICYDNGK